MVKILTQPKIISDLATIPVQPQLLAQTVKVYLANQRQGTQSALTRGEVNRTNKKVYKQKHTGGARHGSRKAPIYVGGGIAFAPKPRDYSLHLNSKMKSLAKKQALASIASEQRILVVSQLKDLSGKTKELAKFLQELTSRWKRILIVTDKFYENIFRAGRNIPGLTITSFSQMNTYQILSSQGVLLMEEAMGQVESFINKENKKNEVNKVSKSNKESKLNEISKTSKTSKKIVTKKREVKKK